VRISTAGWHRNNVDALLRQQTQLARTQNEVATGVRVRTPADDPIAAGRIAALQRAIAESQQYGQNANLATNRLSYEEQALADAGNVLQRVRELAVQAGSATVGPDDRRMLTAEIKTRIEEMLSIANRADGAGEYLFAGSASLTQPFARNVTGVSYSGDSSARMVRISATQSLADGHSGQDVFMGVRAGNGTFATRVGTSNTGNGVIDVGTVINPAAWVRDTYTVQFTAPGSYQVLDSAASVISSGSYTAGNAIEFRGIRVAVTGAPASGDQFVVSPAAEQDIFATLDSLVATLESPTVTGTERARFTTEVGASLQQLDQGINQLLDIRAQVGARLSAIDQAGETREALELELTSLQSGLRDVDYAEAVSRLNQQYAGLQAAQAAYTRIGQMSLFDYL
jgi:flagellar hook-associated protein 3 FlgL